MSLRGIPWQGAVLNRGHCDAERANMVDGDVRSAVEPPPVLQLERLSAWYGARPAIEDVSLTVPQGRITAIIGPSGCGKSTLIRCLNRMHEVVTGARVRGRVLFHGEDVYQPAVDPIRLRRRIGMVFQRPNPFPTRSVFENVVAGYRLDRLRTNRSQLMEVAERALRQAALWDEVKDRLHDAATTLSGGQQQRLCIARALAVEPEVLLMDEPCSSLDPIATLKIEDLMRELVRDYTIVIVTHNLQQAARVSDYTAFLLAEEGRPGTLIEHGPTTELFTNPRDRRTEGYLTGRFG